MQAEDLIQPYATLVAQLSLERAQLLEKIRGLESQLAPKKASDEEQADA